MTELKENSQFNPALAWGYLCYARSYVHGRKKFSELVLKKKKKKKCQCLTRIHTSIWIEKKVIYVCKHSVESK